MDKYIILSPEAKGTFNDRLNFLYLKLGNYLDTEKLENRTLQYCKVFLSDSQNQIREFRGITPLSGVSEGYPSYGCGATSAERQQDFTSYQDHRR